jgi:hypothetical protein
MPGTVSFQAFWLGGSGAVPPPTGQPGTRSFLAFWLGGVAMVSGVVPPTAVAHYSSRFFATVGGMTIKTPEHG